MHFKLSFKSRDELFRIYPSWPPEVFKIVEFSPATRLCFAKELIISLQFKIKIQCAGGRSPADPTINIFVGYITTHSIIHILSIDRKSQKIPKIVIVINRPIFPVRVCFPLFNSLPFQF